MKLFKKHNKNVRSFKRNHEARQDSYPPTLTSVFCYLISGVCSLNSEAHSAHLRFLNDQQVIEVEISRQGLTRIKIQEDRILNVFGVTGEYVMEVDEGQGQIFLSPMGPGSSNPISLTLTTEKGRTQDLRLTPKEKAPEALILQVQESSQDLAEKLAQSLPTQQEIEELFQACQTGRIPLGYKLMPLDIKPFEAPHGIPFERAPFKRALFKRVSREIRGRALKDNSLRETSLRETSLRAGPLRGGPLRGLTYEVKNTSSNPLVIREESFAETPEVIAVLMTTKLLNPGEKAHVYVIKKTFE